MTFSQSFILLIIFIFSLFFKTTAQNEGFRFMFYNTENCFDSFDDSLNTQDDEYLPDSDKHWTFSRYKKKLNNIARVIMVAGEWQPPTVVGLCEIENDAVLKQLIRWTGLGELKYNYIHFESGDHRGIDVALLYRKDLFKPIYSKAFVVDLPGNSRTRDILMVYGVLNKTDSIYFFVNHWPSRYGGSESSELHRLCASKRLIGLCDSIKAINSQASILIMGDFNDTPLNTSILNVVESGFVNMKSFNNQDSIGSNKFRYQWELIDQMLVTPSLIDRFETRQLVPKFEIVNLPFLLEEDPTYLGVKPYRTYQGPMYKGGYSDHLPVMVSFIKKE
jgi:hypothetical protein